MTRLDEREDWRTRRACTLDNATLFDPPEGRDEQKTGDRIRQARAFCAEHCTVGQQCLIAGIRERGSGVFDGVVLTNGHRSKQQYEGTAGRPKGGCGTYSAYRRHRRNGERIDAACLRAASEVPKTWASHRNHRGVA